MNHTKTPFCLLFCFKNYKAIFFLVGVLLVAACATNNLDEADFCPPINAPFPSDNAIPITVATASSRWNCWNLQTVKIAAARHPELNVVIVEPQSVPLEGELTASVTEDFSVGVGPDIFRASLTEIWRLRQLNAISPVTDCVERHPEQFEQIPVELWQAVTLDGEIWAVPIALEPELLFYNKLLLKELGWSEEEIESLPDRIAQSQFLYEDMIGTAEAAVKIGLVEPGFGYWPQLSRNRIVDLNYLAFGGPPDHLQGDVLQISQRVMTDVFAFRQEIAASNLVPPGFGGQETNDWSARLARRDAVAAGRVLFWENHLSEIANYYYNYLSIGAKFTEIYGIASLPARRAIHASFVNASLRVWVIGSNEATGRKNQSIACDLLAYMLIPDVLAQQSVTVMQLPTLPEASRLPIMQQHALMSEVLAASAHLYIFSEAPDKVLFREVTSDYLLRVERGEIAPEEGTIALLAELQAALGDGFRVLP